MVYGITQNASRPHNQTYQVWVFPYGQREPFLLASKVSFPLASNLLDSLESSGIPAHVIRTSNDS